MIVSRTILIALFVVGLAAQPAETQGLIFSHDLHVNDEEIDCLDCHPSDGIETSQYASDRLLPDEEACMMCHDDWKEDGNCESCHQGTQTITSRIIPAANFLFSHKNHLDDNRFECAVCHNDMVGIENLPPLPQMSDCVSCHLDQQETTDCYDCHESNQIIRPKNHTWNWVQDHGIAAMSASNDCLECHVQISCDDCHSGSKLATDNFKLSNPVSIYRKDLQGSKQLIDRVHDLNYVYFHGIDANTKSYECGTCHEVQTFCVDCHQNESELILNKPDFHGGLDWGAVSYPNGTNFSNSIDGGGHAELARMDIERCQACHDIEGADPSCVRCHIDVDGIRFTDPQTHLPGFMSDAEEGDWHENESSLCYVCHTKESEGQGFCAYCHQ